MNKKLTMGIVIMALLYGIISRGLWLSVSPPSLNWDEAALGYNAYSLLQTGRDEYGRFLPLTLRSFDDYKGAIYAYAILPFIAFLGLTETAVRLPSALAGIGLIVLAWLIGKKVAGRQAGAWSSLFVAVSGWGIIFSRTAFESNLALFFLMLGVYLAIFGQKNWLNLAVGAFFLILSAYTYHAEKMVVPILLIWIWWRYRKLFDRRSYLVFGGYVLALGLPLVAIFLQGQGGARFGGTSIGKLWPFKPEQAVFYPLSLPYYFLGEVAGRMMAQLSPATLFVRGSGTGSQQLYLAGIYLVVLILPFMAGLETLIKKSNKYMSLLVLLAIFGVVAGISWDWISLVRSLPFVFLLAVVMGVGMDTFVKRIGKLKNVFVWGFLALVMLESIYNLNSAWMSVPTYYGGDYQAGMSEMMKKVVSHEKNFGRVVIDTSQAQAHIFLLFYGKIDPEKYQRGSNQLSSEELSKHSRFGKYEFRNIYWPDDQKLENTLLVTSPINIGDEKIDQVKDYQVEIIDRMFNKAQEETVRFIAVN